jgi:chromosome partitioning protein
MATIICFANNKGGVGKSSLTMNLGGALSESGKQTLLIDLDPQANLTSVFVDTLQALSVTVADIVYDDVNIEDVIRTTRVEHLDILPVNAQLQDIDARMAGDDDAQFILSEELARIKNRYDYVLIDCPPNLGKATRMALVASDLVIIPIQCQDWSVKGCQGILAHINRVRKRINPALRLLGIVINRFNTRRQMEAFYHEILRTKFNGQLFETVFRDHVPYVEAVIARLPITSYQPNSAQAEVCRKFMEEVMNRAQE